jgi:hypothetical protein
VKLPWRTAATRYSSCRSEMSAPVIVAPGTLDRPTMIASPVPFECPRGCHCTASGLAAAVPRRRSGT